MKVTRWLGGLGLIVAIGSAQASERDVTPIPVGTQELTYTRGSAFVVSEGISTLVQMSVEAEKPNTLFVTLGFLNVGDSSVTVQEGAVSASIRAESGSPRVEVLTIAELERREKNRRAWEAIGAGIAGALESYNAGSAGYGRETSYESGRFRGRTRDGDYFSGRYRGQTTTRTYDPSVARQAREDAAERNREMMDALREEQALREEALDSLLRTHTLRPGDFYAGGIKIEIPRKNRSTGFLLSIRVRVDDEVHPFLVQIDRPVSGSILANTRAVAATEYEALQERIRVALTQDRRPIHPAAIEPALAKPDLTDAPIAEDAFEPEENVHSASREVPVPVAPVQDVTAAAVAASTPDPVTMAVRLPPPVITEPAPEAPAAPDSHRTPRSAATPAPEPLPEGIDLTPRAGANSVRHANEVAAPAEPVSFRLIPSGQLLRTSLYARLAEGPLDGTTFIDQARYSHVLFRKARGTSIRHEVQAAIGAGPNGEGPKFTLLGRDKFRFTTDTKGKHLTTISDGDQRLLSRLIGSSLEFATEPVQLGQIAGTSLNPIIGIRGDVANQLAPHVPRTIEWRFDGVFQPNGTHRNAYLLTSQSISETTPPAPSQAKKVTTSVDGNLVIDASTFAVISQDLSVEVTLHFDSPPTQRFFFYSEMRGTPVR